MSPFEYLDHAADACLRASGTTLEEAFTEAARAMVNLMASIHGVAPTSHVDVSLDADNLELLLVEWLSLLVAQKDVSDMIPVSFKIAIAKQNNGYHLSGTVGGELLSAFGRRLRSEVKGVSYAGLSVARTGNGWSAQCIVDM